MGESLVEERVRDLMPAATRRSPPTPRRARSTCGSPPAPPRTPRADALIAPVEQALRERLGDVVYGMDDETLEYVVVHLLRLLGRTVATAESCTGGLIAQRLTSVSGSSAVFEEGFVTYSNTAKRRYLGVMEETLARFGAVSGETAREMAEGARDASGADLAVSVTGIAGPGGGSAEKPVGTVHIGLAWDGGAVSEHHTFLGGRADVRLRSSQSALALVRRFLMDPDDPQFTTAEATRAVSPVVSE